MTVHKPANIRVEKRQVICEGEWNISNISNLKELLATTTLSGQGSIVIDGSHVTKMDTAGAYLLIQWINEIAQKKMITCLENFPNHTQKLIELVQNREVSAKEMPKLHLLNWIERLGEATIQKSCEFYDYLSFVGKLSTEFLRILGNPKHVRWKALFASIYKTGYQALPIIGLLSCMVGVVLTYQMGVQLRTYGANIFIVDLLGLAVLREFGPLLTAIMIAGRTGSSYTAELGLMKANQEIDALNTLGVTPSELLLLPKIFGLTIALPLLTIWADIFGVLGGMIVSNNMLNLTWHDFLTRFQHQIPLKSLIIGLGKAPIFALIIASIGCFQGMSVTGTAESIGKNTTKSVVYSIFFIILADALFSIIFSKLKL